MSLIKQTRLIFIPSEFHLLRCLNLNDLQMIFINIKISIHKHTKKCMMQYAMIAFK